jgi:hypothetical protein
VDDQQVAAVAAERADQRQVARVGRGDDVGVGLAGRDQRIERVHDEADVAAVLAGGADGAEHGGDLHGVDGAGVLRAQAPVGVSAREREAAHAAGVPAQRGGQLGGRRRDAGAGQAVEIDQQRDMGLRIFHCSTRSYIE